MAEKLKNSYKECKKLYRDILFGFSEKRLKSSKRKIYLKHLNEIDSGETDRKYDDYFFVAQEKGLKSEDQALEFAIEEDLWSEEKEQELKSLRERLKTLRLTKDKLIIKKQVDSILKDIKPLEDQIYLLNHERVQHIGLTAEIFASKKVNEFVIQQSFFSDKRLTEAFYSEEEFDLLEEDEISDCMDLLSEIHQDFSSDQMQLIAICPFFMNIFYLCGENSADFFRKPVIELTNFQTALLSSGRYYKSLISNSKAAPEEYYDSPRKLTEWYHLQDKTQAIKDSMESKGEAGGKTIVGANKKEIKSLETEEEGVLDLGKIAEEKGSLNFDEIIKLHGI